MGKHGAGKQPVRVLPIALVTIAVLAVLALGWWWWTLRGTADPISADPVQSYGSIVTSDPCTAAGAASTVRFNTPNGYITAPLHACGFQPDQSVLVEYLASDPTLVRSAGSPAAEPSVLRRLLPIAILVVGLLGAGVLLLVVRGRRSAHRAGPRRRPAGDPGDITAGVADGPDPAAEPDAAASPAGTPADDDTTEAAEPRRDRAGGS